MNSILEDLPLLSTQTFVTRARVIAPILLRFVIIIITITQCFRSAARLYRAFNRACLCLAYINIILPFYTIALLIKALVLHEASNCNSRPSP